MRLTLGTRTNFGLAVFLRADPTGERMNEQAFRIAHKHGLSAYFSHDTRVEILSMMCLCVNVIQCTQMANKDCTWLGDFLPKIAYMAVRQTQDGRLAAAENSNHCKSYLPSL